MPKTTPKRCATWELCTHLTWWGGSRSDTSETVRVARMDPPMEAKITASSSCVKLCDAPCAGARPVNTLYAPGVLSEHLAPYL